MSVRRARRIARLRRRGVSGHVLPLLLFLADGWGWPQILPSLQAACAKGWLLDRQHMSHPHRVRTRDDVLDNAEQDESFADRPDADAIRAFRTYAYSAIWEGRPDGRGSVAPLATTTLPNMLGLQLTPKHRQAVEHLAHEAEAARAALGVPSSEMGPWLATLSPGDVEAGRQLFWRYVKAVRLGNADKADPGKSTNPLTLGGLRSTDIAASFRSEPGRPTPAQLLGLMIVFAMHTAKLIACVQISFSREGTDQ
jgi:hypothetical protein